LSDKNSDNYNSKQYYASEFDPGINNNPVPLEKTEKKKKFSLRNIPKNVWILIGVVATVLIATGILALIFLPEIKSFMSEENIDRFKNWVKDQGFVGWLVMIGVQILQVVVAFIPGEPVELIAGALYGTWGGYLLCALGCILGTIPVLLISRKLGYKLLYRLFDKDQVDNYTFLKDSSKMETVVFVVFLIPATPKDMLTYFAGVAKIPVWKFVLLTTFARFPSVISSTMLGSSAIKGNWSASLVIFIATALIGVLGIVFKDRIIDKLKSFRKNKEDTK